MIDRANVKQISRITDHLTSKGVYTFDSEIPGMAIAFWSDHLVIITTESDLAIEYERIPDFVRWLRSIDETRYLPLNMPYTFGIKHGRLKISYGENGKISMWNKRLNQLIPEIEGVYEDWKDFKRMKLKGA